MHHNLPKAVHFGAGNIGRGFLGQLYFESGYTTTFIDVMEEVVQGLQERHSYPICITEETLETIVVEEVTAIHATLGDAVAQAIAEADILSTAVGVPVLPRIAPALAKGIALRFEDPDAAPLNIIICENLLHASDFLRAEVEKHLPEALKARFKADIGFVEASVGRMVPVMTEAQKADDPLLVCVEAYCELPVDAEAFKGEIPPIAHLKPIPNFGSYVERKLFVHNMTHAATAYLGHLHGHEYIWQAIRDDAVRELVEKAANESCLALSQKHGLDLDDLHAHRDDLIRRYHNRALGDQVARVGGDPLRKLSKNDRFVGAALNCLEQGINPEYIALAAAAGIRYDHPNDPTAAKVQDSFKQGGLTAVLKEICDIEENTPLANWIAKGMETLNNKGWLV